MEDFDFDDFLDAHRRRAKRLRTSPKMECGSFYIPKSNTEKPQGEDSHFVCEDEQAIGVADGVGGWARKGIDAGEYARQLMANSAAAVQLEALAAAEIDPMSVLRAAYASTACIAALDGGRLRVANVGDSVLWIFRENRCGFISPVQQRRFNCPFQLGNAERSDRPSAAAEMEGEVEPGDVIVLGTDGLLDNVYPSEIEVLLDLMEEEGIELDAEQLAQRIAEIALENSQDVEFCSPFELNAHKSGFLDFAGGKIDDITVIVALIY